MSSVNGAGPDPSESGRALPGLFDADAEDELSLSDPGGPRLANYDPVDGGLDGLQAGSSIRSKSCRVCQARS